VKVRLVIHELDLVVLEQDIAEYRLRRGDVGTVVHVYSDGRAFEVEFLTANGDTIAVLTLERDQVRALAGWEILHVRDVTATPV
jgi:hypothetical protein